MSSLRKTEKNKAIWSLVGIIAILGLIAFWIGMSIGYDFKFQPQHIKRGLDLSGGVSITYEVVNKDELTDSKMADTVAKFQKRAEAFSTESSVYKEGQYRINIDIPGANDAQQVLDKLGSAGKISFIYAQGKRLCLLPVIHSEPLLLNS